MESKKRNKRKYGRSVYQSLAMITQFGINMLVPVCMMSALGIWLDGRLGTSFITIILFMIGALAGGQNIYRMVKSFCADDAGDKERQPVGESNRISEKEK